MFSAILVLVLSITACAFNPHSKARFASSLYGLGGESITSNARSGRDYKGRNAASSAFKPDIVETAISNGNFKTLVAAVSAANLVTTLQGHGPFTVFAPTDEAFSKLPAGTIDALLADIPKLTSILTYHVGSGRRGLGDNEFVDKSIATLNGQNIIVNQLNGQTKVQDANVVIKDIVCKNGLIHVIDAVILPK